MPNCEQPIPPARRALVCWLLLAAGAAGGFACKSKGAPVATQRASASASRAEAKPPLPSPRALDVLQRAARVEILVLGRSDAAPGAAGVLRLPISKSVELSFPIVARLVVSDDPELERVRDTLGRDLIPEATAGWCFEPEYAVRVASERESVLFVLSYYCLSAQIVGPSGPFRRGLVSDGGAEFARILAEHGVQSVRAPPARSAGPARRGE